MREIERVVLKQRAFYETNKTKDIAYRKRALRHLRNVIRAKEAVIQQALYKDLHKHTMEAYMSEIGMVLSECTYQLRHIETWAKQTYVHTPLAQFPAKSYITSEPYGVVLVMSPWNYPFQLTMEPLIGALAAGNTVIVKPSAYAPCTAHIMKEIIAECFDERYVALIEGGREENEELLNQRFDYIFFTGGTKVGKLVLAKASRFLTPVTLELGGKSPCIVEKSANVKLAAKRIAFGKFLNAGQTCVAPDYVFIDASIKNEFLAYMRHYIHQFFGEDPLSCEQYPCIINDKHFHRLLHLMDCGDICMGGRSLEIDRIIEPTVLEHVQMEDAIMKEEIFGPLLPVLTYTVIDEAIHYIQAHEKPLACYVFTTNKKIKQQVLKECSFGGGCINDTIIHLATSNMGFGGVGASGMGSYHGYASFKTFSHFRSIVDKSNTMDLCVRYHPYTKWKEAFVHIFMK